MDIAGSHFTIIKIVVITWAFFSFEGMRTLQILYNVKIWKQWAVPYFPDQLTTKSTLVNVINQNMKLNYIILCNLA